MFINITEGKEKQVISKHKEIIHHPEKPLKKEVHHQLVS